MTRQSLQKVYADFRTGWVDVASPLQHPEGAVKDIVNFDIEINGTLSKRYGLKKSGASYSNMPTVGELEEGFDAHLWENVSKDVNRTFLVVRTGNSLDIFDISHGSLDFENFYLLQTINLPATSQVDVRRKMSTSSALGRFFFAVNTFGAGYLEYDEDSGFISLESISVKFRDLGLWYGPTEEDTGFGTREGEVLPPWAEYNLRNAGWPYLTSVSRESDADAGTFSNVDPAAYTKRTIGNWPSISMPFHAAKAGGGNRINEQVAYSPWQLEVDYFGNSTPASGKFIYDVKEFVREGVESRQFTGQAGSVPDVVEVHQETYKLNEEMSKIAFYAGRLWYYSSGDYESSVNTDIPKSPLNNDGTFYFSQTIDRNLNNVGKCYQENDPTAEDINQLLATDGGSLSIKEVGDVKSIIPLGTSLYIISDQGIWRITGKDFNSFQADSQSIDKISDKGVLSENGIAVSRDTIYTLTEDGVFSVSTTGQVGEVSYNDLSSPLIKNFFYNLPEKSVESAIVRFDRTRNLMLSFLAIPDDDEVVDKDFYRKGYNTVLIYNSDLNCFYKYRIDLPEGYRILDGVYGLKTSVVNIPEPVFDSNGGLYTDSSSEVYTIPGDATFKSVDNLIQVIIYDGVSIYPASFTDNVDYTDLGADYTAEVEIGYDAIGSLISEKKKAVALKAFLEPVFLSYGELLDNGNIITPAPELLG